MKPSVLIYKSPHKRMLTNERKKEFVLHWLCIVIDPRVQQRALSARSFHRNGFNMRLQIHLKSYNKR